MPPLILLSKVLEKATHGIMDSEFPSMVKNRFIAGIYGSLLSQLTIKRDNIVSFFTTPIAVPTHGHAKTLVAPQLFSDAFDSVFSIAVTSMTKALTDFFLRTLPDPEPSHEARPYSI